MSRSTASRRTVLQAAGAAGLAAALAGRGRPARAAPPSFKTVEPGVITVATSGDMPMAGVENGQLIGTDGEMINAIAERLGLKTKTALMEWSATIESVKSNRADIMLANMGWTPVRARVLRVTDAIYYAGSFAAMRGDTDVGPTVEIAEFEGRSIGTVTGFTIVPEMKKVPGTTGVKLYDTSDACVRDVAAGRLDFAMLDAPTVDYMILKAPDLKMKQLPITLDESFPQLTSKQHTVMGMSPDNVELFDAVNAGVAWLWRTGLNARLLAKYGVGNPDYLQPPPVNPRLGVDRDEAGRIVGAWAHEPKDYGDLFT